MIAEHESIPFSVQGSECGVAVEGVQTLVFEVLEQAAAQGHTSLDFSDLFIQVGGGALGAGLSQGLQRAADGEVERVVPGLKIPQVRGCCMNRMRSNQINKSSPTTPFVSNSTARRCRQS